MNPAADAPVTTDTGSAGYVRRTSLWARAATGAMTAAVFMIVVAPPDRLQGDVQRLLYVHVPTAWLAYLAFAVTLLGSAAWLATRRQRWDRLAAASAEVGVVFTGLTLALGSIWGKPVWGVWWTWDPRLVTTALLFFVYLGYLALRRATIDPVLRARRSALLGIVSFIQVPVIHFSVVWWRTLHQPATVLRPSAASMAPSMLAALFASLAAFTLIYVVLLRTRIRLLTLEELAEARTAERPVAGDDVRPVAVAGGTSDG
ncbi:cytochrome c biogenesis protein CcsA [Euzebya tangerina]|uniref:cytochrome c biogenesis protein CcsA n=1 Tax=Euzebya tangerina TaxID=591198 RepID=UPI000E315992|nr:cytochrome c biogenesis protein CcsA [Euzebya tangerina]